MKAFETILWDTDIQTWQFPLDHNQELRLSTCHACVDDGYVAIAAVAPFDHKEPKLILSRPVSIPDLKVEFFDERDEPFIIRFGRMPLSVLMTLREHDGW